MNEPMCSRGSCWVEKVTLVTAVALLVVAHLDGFVIYLTLKWMIWRGASWVQVKQMLSEQLEWSLLVWLGWLNLLLYTGAKLFRAHIASLLEAGTVVYGLFALGFGVTLSRIGWLRFAHLLGMAGFLAWGLSFASCVGGLVLFRRRARIAGATIDIGEHEKTLVVVTVVVLLGEACHWVDLVLVDPLIVATLGGGFLRCGVESVAPCPP